MHDAWRSVLHVSCLVCPFAPNSLSLYLSVSSSFYPHICRSLPSLLHVRSSSADGQQFEELAGHLRTASPSVPGPGSERAGE